MSLADGSFVVCEYRKIYDYLTGNESSRQCATANIPAGNLSYKKQDI